MLAVVHMYPGLLLRNTYCPASGRAVSRWPPAVGSFGVYLTAEIYRPRSCPPQGSPQQVTERDAVEGPDHPSWTQDDSLLDRPRLHQDCTAVQHQPPFIQSPFLPPPFTSTYPYYTYGTPLPLRICSQRTQPMTQVTSGRPTWGQW